MIILGIDPGSARAGYGVLEKKGGKLRYLGSGLLSVFVEPNKNKRLLSVERGLLDLLEEFKPAIVGVEKIYFTKNLKTAVEVAQARGVIILNVVKKDIPLVEASPTEIKLAVTGDGRASKKAVAKMVGRLLGQETQAALSDDVTDALAVAIAVSNYRPLS